MPRKEQPIRGKKGRLNREMFAKLRSAKYMKERATSNEVAIEFAGKVQRMVRVHHCGLRDKPSSHSKDTRYQARPLLVLTERDFDSIEELIIQSFEE